MTMTSASGIWERTSDVSNLFTLQKQCVLSLKKKKVSKNSMIPVLQELKRKNMKQQLKPTCKC